MSAFEWNEKRDLAALLLSQGFTQLQVAEKTGISQRTIRRWEADTEFSAEVDRLSLMVDIAGRAQRLRLAMRAVRQKIGDGGKLETDKDLLDWLKFAQSETDGVKLDLAALFEAQASVAGQGSNRTDQAAGDKPPHDG